jgi:hypothetical protein
MPTIIIPEILKKLTDHVSEIPIKIGSLQDVLNQLIEDYPQLQTYVLC